MLKSRSNKVSDGTYGHHIPAPVHHKTFNKNHFIQTRNALKPGSVISTLPAALSVSRYRSLKNKTSF